MAAKCKIFVITRTLKMQISLKTRNQDFYISVILGILEIQKFWNMEFRGKPHCLDCTNSSHMSQKSFDFLFMSYDLYTESYFVHVFILYKKEVTSAASFISLHSLLHGTNSRDNDIHLFNLIQMISPSKPILAWFHPLVTG